MNASESPHPLIDLDWIRQASGAPDLPVQECLWQADRVGPNILFDVVYYRQTYGRNMPAGMTCLEHFCRQSMDAPRNPNALFSTQQWHETISSHLPDRTVWRSVLFGTLADEARFSRDEQRKHESGAVILSDLDIGSPPETGQTICLFAHYDAQGEVQDYVLDYIDALREQGCCIVFLTSNSALSTEARSKLGGRAWRLVHCDNLARDFGLYAIGVRLLDRLGVTGHPVILANDSVIGTMNSLEPLFQVARSGPFDITGAVDCLLHNWHLQSFFLYCTADLVDSDIWKGFWNAYKPHRDRWFVVNSHEFGFSRWMSDCGVRMGAAWRYDDIIRNAATDWKVSNPRVPDWHIGVIKGDILTNPTTELWDVMLKAGFPFLKKAVFTTPLLSNNLLEVCNVLSARSGAASQLAEASSR